MTRRLDDQALALIAIAVFLAMSAVHIVCGDFPKAIDVLPDERRYLEIARSLFAGEGLVIRGEASDFQKILYPLSLFPALVFRDGADQVRMMGVLSSLYACSTVFPALLIARRIFRDPHAVVACMAFSLITPDLMYSMTFMSESVFMPLSLWLVYLCWRCFESSGKRELALAAASGALCYVVYLCKEVAWMYLIAFVAFYIAAGVRKRRARKRAAAAAALYLAGYFVPFAAMKLTLFSGLSNSYSQFGFDILLSPYTVLFGLYSLAVDGVHFVVGFGVFPVIYLACTYGKMPRKTRDLLFFCLVSLVVGLAVVVFTISMREDVGHVALRQHLRYVAPLAVVLLMLFVKQVSRLDPADILSSPRRCVVLAAATAGFCGLVVSFFGGANLSQGFDYAQFHFMRWLLGESQPLAQERFVGSDGTLSAIDDSDGDLLVIDPLNWAFRAAVVLFTCVGTILLMNRDKRVRLRAGGAICAVIATAMVANSVALAFYNRNAYGVEQSHIDEICAISDRLALCADGEEVVVALDKKNTGPNNLIDTYLQDGRGRYSYRNVSSVSSMLASGDDRDDLPDYLLANENQDLDLDKVVATPIIGDDGSRFVLYHLRKR